jgi:4-amino-4-deoxy-L-arabinose transferase-like glycosyltransferase
VSTRKIQLLVVLSALVVLLPSLGAVRLFDWDEINFAESAREMIETNNYLQVQIDYRPFYEKPPLFIWLQTLSMQVFGINEFAARFPNVVVGITTLLVAFSIGSRMHSKRFGILWMVCFAGSILPHFYMRSGIIDPLFNLLMFLAIWWIYRSVQEPSTFRWPLAAGIATGLAALTKGPVGLGLVGLTSIIAWFVTHRALPFPWRTLFVVFMMALVVPSLWIGTEYLMHGPTFMTENLAYQWRLLTTGEAGHAQPWYYHLVVVAIGCFPASVFIWQGARTTTQDDQQQRDFLRWMIVLLCVVMAVFSAVTTKIVHYSSFAYLPLTYLAARALNRRLDGDSAGLSLLQSCGLLTLGALLSALFCIVPLAFINKQWLLGLPTFRDVYLRAAMSRDVQWLGFEQYIGVLLLASTIITIVTLKSRPRLAIGSLFGGVVLMLTLFLPLVAPRIEAYTQGAALDFYESLQGTPQAVQPLSMKSYAHLFYTRKSPDLAGMEPAWYVCRINNIDEWKNDSTKQIVDTSGAFVIFRRTSLLQQPRTP